jgi:hypothetical protein
MFARLVAQHEKLEHLSNKRKAVAYLAGVETYKPVPAARAAVWSMELALSFVEKKVLLAEGFVFLGLVAF